MVFSLKGWDNIAQGNAGNALGFDVKIYSRLKAWDKRLQVHQIIPMDRACLNLDEIYD